MVLCHMLRHGCGQAQNTLLTPKLEDGTSWRHDRCSYHEPSSSQKVDEEQSGTFPVLSIRQDGTACSLPDLSMQ